jgi:hypothetical protein
MTLSTFGFFFDLASVSPTSVRGESRACSTKYLLLSSVKTIAPSAQNGANPLM